MKAEIICVGTELLLGNILNTNAQFLSEKLSEYGVDLYYQTVVGDNEQRLFEVVQGAMKRADLLIFSGGLGPTNDDITKEVVAKAFGKQLVLHEESLAQIRETFQSLGREMTENNKKQAYVPQGCRVLENHNGTAPGILMEEGEKAAILLPGPPMELIPMFEESVVPYLQEKSDAVIRSKTLRVFGMGESKAADLLKDLLENQKNPSIAPYAKNGEVHLRVTAKAADEKAAVSMVEELAKKAEERLCGMVYGYDEEDLSAVIVRMLREQGRTIAAAESCTGGYFAKMITQNSGASDVIAFSAVTYRNDFKEKVLGVPHRILEKYGAVSEQTAAYMARGIRRCAGSDIGIGITGVAGPTGGSAEKPVGLVYVSLATPGGLLVRKLQLGGNREKVRYQTCLHALDLTRRYLADSK